MIRVMRTSLILRGAVRMMILSSLLGAGITGAQAGTVLYSNLGNPPQFDPGNGWSIDGGIAGGQLLAVQFTPPFNRYFLEDVRLPLGISFTNLSQSPIDVFLADDLNGLPNSDLADLKPLPGQSVGAFPPGNMVTYTCSTCPLLVSGTPYWIVAGIPNTDLDHFGTTAEWNWNTSMDYSSGSNFAFNDTQFGTGWSLASNEELRPAFQVDGVPEPGSMALLGFGLSAFLVLRRRLNGGTERSPTSH